MKCVKLLLAVLLLSLGVSCAKQKPIEIQTVAVEKTPLNLSAPEPIKTRKVTWFIITPENYVEIFSKLEKQKTDLVLFGLTDTGYQNISLNMAEIKRFIAEQDAIIKQYKKYYETKENKKPRELIIEKD